MLDENKIKYQLYQHKSVFTSAQAALVRGTDLAQGAKAIVMFADGKPVILVLPANLKIDFRKFKSLYKIKNLKMADKEEVKKLTGLEIGSIPPFSHIFNLPLFIDERLFENKEIVFNTGLHTRSIKMTTADYKNIAKGKIGQFSA